MNENAANALKAWREAGGVTERLNPVERSKKNPNSKTMAIKAMCWDCSGESATEAANCQVQKCPLYLFNPYKKKSNETQDELGD